MLCEKCKKNNATFFFEENINGKKRSFALCNECADEMKKSGEIKTGESLFDSPFYTDPFASVKDSLFGTLFGAAQSPYALSSKKSCPSCGFTFEDFRRTGKAGCPDCYKAFSEELEGSIRQIHGSAVHEGRAPAASKKKHEKENMLKSLKKELKNAISNEEFEMAAELRDKIKELEADKGGED